MAPRKKRKKPGTRSGAGATSASRRTASGAKKRSAKKRATATKSTRAKKKPRTAKKSARSAAKTGTRAAKAGAAGKQRKAAKKRATAASPRARTARPAAATAAPSAPPPEPPAADPPDRAVAGRPADAELAEVTPADLSALDARKLYYRIGEVSRITGVKAYVLRYWESEFRLMTPQKSRSRQRLYRQKDIETILHIKRLLYEERYTIAGARKQLRRLGAERVREESRKRHRLGDGAEEPAEDAVREAPPAGIPAPPVAAARDRDGAYGAILAELRELRTALAAGL